MSNNRPEFENGKILRLPEQAVRKKSELSLSMNKNSSLDALMNSSVRCHFKAGQTIFYSGNEPLGFFIIQKGLVKLEAVSNAGTSHTLRMKGSGDILGYRSLFANEPYQATAVALEDCELCFLSKIEINTAIEKNYEIALLLLECLAKDLRGAEEKWIRQMNKGAAERIADSLLFLHDRFSPLNWTRREIAQWAGTTPETVIRTLAQFEKEGLIDQTDGRSIRIISREKLSKKAST